MQLSAKKQRDLTYLEVQAQQMVNEEDFLSEHNHEVNDEQRYEQMVEKKKDRRAVRLRKFHFDIGWVIVRFFGEASQEPDAWGPWLTSSKHFTGTT